MYFVLTFCFGLFLSVSRVQARYNFNFIKASGFSSLLSPQYVTLPLDHFGDNSTTFLNRYWVNDEFYKPGGPVILLDGGEGDASSAVAALSFGQGADQLPDYAQRFGGLLILWEHRFYGGSLPGGFVDTTMMTPDELATYFQYLTFEQALEDVAVFARNFSLSTYPKQDLRPNSVPWVFVGGSYPGVRAAYMRLRNPEIIFASLASSAPVQLQEDFWQYYVAEERKLASTSGDLGCLHDLNAFASYINTVVTKRNVTAAVYLLSTIGYPGGLSADNSDSAWETRRIGLETMAELPTGDFQDYGLAGGLGNFCLSLTSPSFTNDTSATRAQLQNGIVSYYGIDRAVQIYAQVIASGSRYVVNNATVAGHSQKKTGLGRRPDQQSLSNDEYAWLYQTCTEAGYFQDSNSSSPNNIIPGFVDVPTWIQDTCVSNFGNRTASGPDVSKINNKYQGWHMSTTNVLFVNGEYDPWRALSVASDVDPASPGNTMTSKIPEAGKALSSGTYFGFLIKNGLHVSDLSYDLAAVRTNSSLPGSVDESANEAHELFATALSSWLPAYTKFAASNQTASKTSPGTGSYLPTPTASLGPSSAQSQTPSPSVKSSGTRNVLVSAWALTLLALGMAFWA